MSTTNLMDRFARQAAETPAGIIEPKPKRRFGFAEAPAPQPASAAGGIPRLTKEEIAKLKAAGAIRETPAVAAIAKPQAMAAELAGVRVQFMAVTPAVAAEWLKNNFRNRPVKEDVVAAYARDMVAGVFITTHQGVAFNDRDELIDGQHRLLAIVKSGVTVKLLVTFGLPSQIEGREMTTMDAVDRGRPRSVADQLKIQHGLKDGSAIAMVTASIAGICSNERTRRLGVGQTLEIYRAFEPGITFVIAHRVNQPGLRAAGVLAAFAFAHTVAPGVRVLIEEWFRRLMTGERIGTVPALAKLRDFLTSDEAVLLSRGNDRALAELTLQALNVARLDGPVSEVKVCPDGAVAWRAMDPARVEQVARLFRLPEPAGKANLEGRKAGQ